MHIIELLSWDRIIIIHSCAYRIIFSLPLEVSAHCTFCYFPLVLFVLCHFLLFPISYTAWTVLTDFTVSLPKTAFKHVLKWLASYKNKNKKTETWICLFYLKGKWKQMGPRIFFLMKKKNVWTSLHRFWDTGFYLLRNLLLFLLFHFRLHYCKEMALLFGWVPDKGGIR